MRRIKNILRGFVQAYGTEGIKRKIWNSEFSGGRWDCLDQTPGDCVYPFVEKYANGGSILDMGCGSGSTANELNPAAYGDYTGTDISDVAIQKAKRRTEENGRIGKSRFFAHDMSSYVPDKPCDVILFRDSIYYLPPGKAKSVLQRYAKSLTPTGVFVVRMYHDSKSRKMFTMLAMIEGEFDVVEKFRSENPSAIVVVFRAKSAAGSH